MRVPNAADDALLCRNYRLYILNRYILDRRYRTFVVVTIVTLYPPPSAYVGFSKNEHKKHFIYIYTGRRAYYYAVQGGGLDPSTSPRFFARTGFYIYGFYVLYI